MAKLDVDIICPGHGTLARKDLLATEKRYFAELREHVQEGHRRQEVAGRHHRRASTSRGTRSGPAWSVVETPMNKDNVKHVYDGADGQDRPRPAREHGRRRSTSAARRPGLRRAKPFVSPRAPARPSFWDEPEA